MDRRQRIRRLGEGVARAKWLITTHYPDAVVSRFEIYGSAEFVVRITSSSSPRRFRAGIEHRDGDGAEIFARACQLGAEGIVSKHREHPYRSGPSKA
jgi:hypothetical protein